jgi:hypothetical protein
LKKILFILLLLPVVAFTPNDLKLLTSIKGSFDFFTSDNLGNIYTVEGCVLKKFNTKGELLQSFSEKSLGNIFSVDASNPMKILVFYKDFRQVIFLDNTLSISGSPIVLDDLGIGQPQYVCTSYDNNFWVFDQLDFVLKRFDINLQQTAQSSNLSQVTEKSVKPLYIEEQGNNVYLSDSLQGIIILDKFGTYNKTLPFTGVQSLQSFDNAVWYIKNDILNKYIFKNFETITMELPEKNIRKIRVSSELLFIHTSEGISIYQTDAKKQ